MKVNLNIGSDDHIWIFHFLPEVSSSSSSSSDSSSLSAFFIADFTLFKLASAFFEVFEGVAAFVLTAATFDYFFGSSSSSSSLSSSGSSFFDFLATFDSIFFFEDFAFCETT